ncbi:MAG: alpha/beta hydrolase [Candidatus Hydrogenedentes bacterium]|nr:alpha/beta hydrolase [Candidatus Hydrogenedentota bacterium]
MKRIIKWTLIVIPALAVLLYLVLLAGLWAMQERLMFGRADTEIREMPDARGWTYEDVWCDVDGEKTHGWWIPLENARGTILFAHGSGRNISGYLEDVALYREAGFSVLLYDYGGYGASGGAASEARCYADARAMWDYLVDVRKMSADRIVLAGSSMGGGVTLGLAVQVSPAALILESTFTSVPDVLSEAYPFIPARWICRIQFRNMTGSGSCVVRSWWCTAGRIGWFLLAMAENCLRQLTCPRYSLKSVAPIMAGSSVHGISTCAIW